MTSPNHELSILLPRPASLTNSDDWPIFELKGVDIFDPSDPLRLTAVLLHAGSYKPLTITGKLAPLATENNHLLLKHSYARNQPIEITDVKEFSYGQYDNGNIDLWAAGHAGWYTIHPSRAYRDVYMNMLQSIRLLYFAGDSYKSVKTHADLPIERFFYNYWNAHPDMCDSVESAEALFDEHRYFLIASMLSGKEGLDWGKVPLFDYMKTKFPDDAKVIRERLLFKPKKSPSRKASTQSPAPSNASLKRKRAAPKERTATPVESIRPHSRAQSVSTAAPSIVGLDGINEEAPRRRGRPRKNPLRPALQPDIQTSFEPIMEPAAEPVTEPNGPTEAIEPTEPAESSVSTPQPPKESSSSEDESSELGQRGHKGKSALRPRPSKYFQLSTTLDDAIEDRNDETEEPELVKTLYQGSVSKRNTSIMLRASSSLRRSSQLQLGDPDEMRITSPDSTLDEGVDMALDGDNENSYNQAQAGAVENATGEFSLRFREDVEKESDIWRCPQDGCMHKVYAASQAESQRLVTEHQRMHEYDDDERVQLIRRMEAPWLPVGRLMGRVRELAGRNGMPPPIVQRY